MAPDRLAVLQQRGDGLTEDPGELAAGARLALVDLRALGVQSDHGGFSGHRDRGRHLRRGSGRKHGYCDKRSDEH